MLANLKVQNWAKITGDEHNLNMKMPNCNMLHALVTDVNPPICCLCLNSITEKSPLQLEDEIYLENCSEGNVTVVEMIDCVLHREDYVSTSVCASCITSTVSAFRFIDMCEQASKRLNKVVDSITSGLDGNEKKNFRSIYRLFIATDVNSLQSTLYYDNKKNIIHSKTSTITSPEISPTCSNCGLTFNYKMSLVRHIKNKICAEMPCDSCGLFMTRSCMLKHKKVCGREGKKKKKKTLCSICGKSVSSITVHLKVHDQNSKTKCQKCGKKLTNYNGSFKEHAKICQKSRSNYPSESKYKCNTCKAEYTKKANLKFHMKIHSDNPNDYVVCPFCNKRFPSQVYLNLHAVTHTQEKNYECTICNGKFVSKASLTYHIRTHTGEKPYSCELCELKFLSASRRRDHMRRHHLPPQLQCLFCEKKFRGFGGLAKHHRLHLNPKSGLYIGKTQIDILAQTNGKVSALITKNSSRIETNQKNNNKKNVESSEDSCSSYEE